VSVTEANRKLKAPFVAGDDVESWYHFFGWRRRRGQANIGINGQLTLVTPSQSGQHGFEQIDAGLDAEVPMTSGSYCGSDSASTVTVAVIADVRYPRQRRHSLDVSDEQLLQKRLVNGWRLAQCFQTIPGTRRWNPVANAVGVLSTGDTPLRRPGGTCS
jgi:hypothetical protein